MRYERCRDVARFLRFQAQRVRMGSRTQNPLPVSHRIAPKERHTGFEQERSMMYYGRNTAGANREPDGDGNKRHSCETQCQRGDCGEPLPKRSNWAWAVGRAHYDWMEAHSPFSSYD